MPGDLASNGIPSEGCTKFPSRTEVSEVVESDVVSWRCTICRFESGSVCAKRPT